MKEAADWVRCGYNHDWQSLPDGASRCFVCSALTHRKQDCPAKPVGDKAPTGGSGGQDTMGQGHGNKEAKEQKELRKEKEKETRMAKGMDQRRSP